MLSLGIFALFILPIALWAGRPIWDCMIRGRREKPIACRICHETHLMLVAEDEGPICMPCLRFKEAMAELEEVNAQELWDEEEM